MFHGEVKALVVNTGKEACLINEDEYFCQLVIIPILKPPMLNLARLKPTKRGEGGFGSTTEPLPKLHRRDAVVGLGAEAKRCPCGRSINEKQADENEIEPTGSD